MRDIHKGETKSSNESFEGELHASYDMLENRYLDIEVWKYNKWSLNLFLGKNTVKLKKIA